MIDVSPVGGPGPNPGRWVAMEHRLLYLGTCILSHDGPRLGLVRLGSLVLLFLLLLLLLLIKST